MVHLIYGSRVYLNIDTLRTVEVDTRRYMIELGYDDGSKYLDVCNHPKVKEILADTRKEELDATKLQVCYKVLGVIIERLANTDEKASPIINLEAGLATLQKASPEEEKKPAEVIPVTVDKDGNITKVIKEEE
jgi:hypothetical protein